MANIADKLGLTNDVREIKIGKSFGSNGNSCFHTIRYDFKPASVDTKKMATVDIGEGNQVTVTVPHIEGSGTAQTVFKGSKKPYQKECVLIIDHNTGEITLEKLSCNVQLKKTRAEPSSRNRSITPVDNVLSKKSPPNQKGSPQKPLWSSSNHHSPVQKCSPLPRSPPNCSQQLSPTNQTSPSMPCLVPPNSSNPKHSVFTPQETSINSVGDNIEHMEQPEVGVLSSSESSDSSSNSSSSRESSDAEGEDMSKKPSWLPHPVFSSTPANHGSRSSTSSQPLPTNVLPSMPKFSQLSEDLQLSESDSD